MHTDGYDQKGYYVSEDRETYYYGEMRFAGLSRQRLKEVMLEVQIMLLNKGVLEFVDVEIERTDSHGDFKPIKGKEFKLKG